MIGFASFPVLENVKQESIEYYKTADFSDSDDIIYYVLGFVLGFLSFMLLFLPLLFLFSKRPKKIVTYLFDNFFILRSFLNSSFLERASILLFITKILFSFPFNS